MKHICIMMLAGAVCWAVAGCQKNVRQSAERAETLVITWEFTSADRDGEPWTEASLVINGSKTHTHRIGAFYGRVRKILSPAEINREMIGGTLSGFITTHGGRGHEVIVRYNEQLQRLIVAERPCGNASGAGLYRVIKNIPVPEMKREKIGF